MEIVFFFFKTTTSLFYILISMIMSLTAPHTLKFVNTITQERANIGQHFTFIP